MTKLGTYAAVWPKGAMQLLQHNWSCLKRESDWIAWNPLESFPSKSSDAYRFCTCTWTIYWRISENIGDTLSKRLECVHNSLSLVPELSEFLVREEITFILEDPARDITMLAPTRHHRGRGRARKHFQHRATTGAERKHFSTAKTCSRDWRGWESADWGYKRAKFAEDTSSSEISPAFPPPVHVNAYFDTKYVYVGRSNISDGLGVWAAVDIPAGTDVTEYCGFLVESVDGVWISSDTPSHFVEEEGLSFPRPLSGVASWS